MIMDLLTGTKIRLRPLETSDLDVLYEWENQPGNWYAGANLTPFSRFFLEQYIIGAQNDIYADKQLRLIIETHQKQQAGIIDLFDFDAHHRRAAVGILIGRPFRRRGYAAEALQLLIRYAKDVLSLHQLYCTIEENNPESVDLFAKKGFVITGTRQQWNRRGDKWTGEDFLQLIFRG